MREVIGQRAQMNLQINNDEYLVRFVDFTGIERVQVYTKGETAPLSILPIMVGTTPVISL